MTEPESGFMRDPQWYKDAVIYQLHVKSFFDSNGDGVGDFPGLIQKLDYIANLGVNTIWLLPFYPSPRRDDGYDIAAYRGVHSDYGSLADVRRFIKAAHQRGLRVITELVINHTSDQHPWFQRARNSPKGSKARDFYVWSDTDERYQGTRIIFLDTETSNWTWDPVAKQYFWHRFYSHQPDLNFDNPQVLKAVLGVMRYWLDMGVDGLRLDAIPYLVEREGTNNENLPETHEVLKAIRAELDAHYSDRLLLAEANQWPEDTQMYFGDGDECHMAFHFPLMPRMYMALAQEDRFPITDILRQTPEIPEGCQWAIFLRNHDELTLEMVSDRERDYLWDYYAADRRARINLGIRRRLAPLLERDRRRIELLNSLLLSMPGTPTLYYGDEIGMGDNIILGDRDGVRTPMQWSIDRNGGFSTADPERMVLPPIVNPLYGFQAVNVETQARDPHSLLNWTRRMLTVRSEQKAFGRGTLRMLAPANRRILAYLRQYTDASGHEETILCVANLSRAAQAVELDLSEFSSKVPVEMLGGSSFAPVGDQDYTLTLPPYGFFWFVLADDNRLPSWHIPAPQPMPELRTLVIKKDLAEIAQGALRDTLTRELLPTYLARRRWFAGDGQPSATELRHLTVFGGDKARQLLVEISVDDGSQTPACYQLPLAFLAEQKLEAETGRLATLQSALALARVRKVRDVGLLTDATTVVQFSQFVLQQLRASKVDISGGEVLHYLPAARLAQWPDEDGSTIEVSATEQSNTSIRIGQSMILKVLRRVQPGIHPEAEMSAMLCGSGFTQVAPFLGEIRREGADGSITTLMILQGFIENQGDAWQWTLDTLQRAIRDELMGGISALENQFTALAELQTFSGLLGEHLAKMHVILSQQSRDPAFAVRQMTPDDANDWGARIAAELAQLVNELQQQRGQLIEPALTLCDRLIDAQEALLTQIQTLSKDSVGGLLMRVHGDLHLGQVLVAHGDAVFVDFEGEPSRTLAERRDKHSPYKDVAGLLRSFSYAAAMAARPIDPKEQSEAVEQTSQALAARYLQQARESFINAYQENSGEIAHAWAQEEGAAAAMRLCLLEKAIYEIRYELVYRPEWIAVPLQGLHALLDQLTPENQDDLTGGRR
ncbi:maltose alpha-D-glucosyltransferase [Pseudomonas sp. EL_65y_Pfl2_R95]|uniref:maltose alpha-D-glucosyltransferase n=1 Tax=Pseudomonas sp. EL_65y_Pfl2_R95 TaxID=3088698 RepID=UPI0030D9EB35